MVVYRTTASVFLVVRQLFLVVPGAQTTKILNAAWNNNWLLSKIKFTLEAFLKCYNQNVMYICELLKVFLFKRSKTNLYTFQIIILPSSLIICMCCVVLALRNHLLVQETTIDWVFLLRLSEISWSSWKKAVALIRLCIFGFAYSWASYLLLTVNISSF